MGSAPQRGGSAGKERPRARDEPHESVGDAEADELDAVAEDEPQFRPRAPTVETHNAMDVRVLRGRDRVATVEEAGELSAEQQTPAAHAHIPAASIELPQIGRASCRERG